MKTMLFPFIAMVVAGSVRSAAEADPAKPVAESGATQLAGTSWKLVKIVYGDDKVHTPDDPLKYTFAFLPEGRVTARIDCNRGNGTWASSEPGKISFGPMASTVMLCPPGSLDRFVFKDLPNFTCYELREGRLLLSLKDGVGIYEFAPHTGKPTRKTFKVP